ncbi:MAG: bifunctional glutamate N-acetyltransferase/amino-acid acetyltransferase ArgJ [Deltaproteobacteria bacterium]|nr:bifunctional glutamate N-acetyltransferase/amino-acid acetyltransferase ArgJ [Deltaproteobacteria bacterium]MBW2445848.1 bifunctional glutamate N-acetyltransferase/amino-acid acetyltransferase ArgJ [Deltaproteobacteria bacterium]
MPRNKLRPPAEKIVLPKGFRAGGVHCGIKKRGLDLALVASDEPASVAGVFTKSTVVGAPVELSRDRLPRRTGRGVVVNSGISNVGMGARGRRAAASMARSAAQTLGCDEEDVLVASTGVIGEPLPIEKIRAALPRLAESLTPERLDRAARAILTTDTVPKWAEARTRIDGRWVRVAGIAKGSGMIEPNMATMLSFLFTDAAVSPRTLHAALREVADETYNRLTIDGEGSTSDTVLLFANGCAGNPPLRTSRSAGTRRFTRALHEVAEDLVRQLARDGEGATTLVTVNVSGAKNPEEADRAARRIANSLLVKTAIFGRDPNWGRILQTIGAGRVKLDAEKTEVRLCGVPVYKGGRSTGPAARKKAAKGLSEPEVAIDVRLGAGRSSARMFTCDLTTDYVRINAEYTT